MVNSVSDRSEVVVLRSECDVPAGFYWLRRTDWGHYPEFARRCRKGAGRMSSKSFRRAFGVDGTQDGFLVAKRAAKAVVSGLLIDALEMWEEGSGYRMPRRLASKLAAEGLLSNFFDILKLQEFFCDDGAVPLRPIDPLSRCESHQCADCDYLDDEYADRHTFVESLKPVVWIEGTRCIGRGGLCMPCFEFRLGRKVTAEDFEPE